MISEDKNRLTTGVDANGNEIGIALWEIYSCLRYYKRDKAGKRNLSLPIQFGGINKWAKCKPFASPEQNFETVEARDIARRNANQGLIIPTAYNSGVSTTDNPRMQTYIGTLIEKAREGVAPNWEYRRPLGGAFNEPFRTLDFDGYKHLESDGSCQPYETNILGLNKSRGTDNDVTIVNRFVQGELTCRLSKKYADLKFSDILPNDNYYHFYVEVYDANAPYGLDEQDPKAVYVCPQQITEVADNDWQDVVLNLADMMKIVGNGRFIFVLGINRFSAGVENAPDADGVGFIEPWNGNLLPVYNVRVDYYAVINYLQKAGYYVASGSSSNFTSFNPKDYDFTGWRKTYSDKVGLALDFQRMAEDYTIVGGIANVNNLPQSGFKIWVRARYQDRYVVATVAGSDIQSNVSTNGNNYKVVFANQDEKQTVYLRFDGLIKQGEQIDSIELQFSTDGTTYAPLGNVEAGFDGSSVRLRLQY
jgi:hypothetical protein